MRFLRRQTAGAAATPVTGSESESDTAGTGGDRAGGRTPGKGRPTPKRREAETKRRGPAPPPPRTQREAVKLARKSRGGRDERRKAAADRRARMMAGDDSALMPRDRGPVKAFVRDTVDSRRHLMGLFMPLAGLVFVSLLLPIPRLQSLLSLFCMAMLVAMVVEGVLLGRQVTRRARERFPNERVSGPSLGWYAFTRCSQLRRLRVPKPRVGYGAQV